MPLSSKDKCGDRKLLAPLWPPGFPQRGPPEATARGFEPLRAEPNGFLVHHLSHSVTLSHVQRQARLHDTTVTEMHREPNSHASADVDRQFKQQSPLQHEASVAASSAACLPHWQPSCRQRGDSSPCGQSPMDFKSISLAARTQCQCKSISTDLCINGLANNVHLPLHISRVSPAMTQISCGTRRRGEVRLGMYRAQARRISYFPPTASMWFIYSCGAA